MEPKTFTLRACSYGEEEDRRAGWSISLNHEGKTRGICMSARQAVIMAATILYVSRDVARERTEHYVSDVLAELDVERIFGNWGLTILSEEDE